MKDSELVARSISQARAAIELFKGMGIPHDCIDIPALEWLHSHCLQEESCARS